MKTTNIQDAAMMSAPLTSRELVGIAHVLIDAEVSASLEPDADRTFHAGALKGITAMCKAATSALNACSANASIQQAGAAPADQQGDDQSNQAVTPQSGGGDQRPAPPQQAGLIFSKLQHANLILSEKRAGSIIDMATGVIYDVMLMPGELECVTWAEAKSQIMAAGGDLPTRDEILLLHKLLGSLAFRENQYWTDDKVKFIGEPGESISYFCDGWFEITEATDRMRARGIRRISVGDVADDGADPIDDSYVVVPAPGFTARAGTSASESWGLAGAPSVPAAPGTARVSSRLTSGKMNVLELMQERACALLEATGDHKQVEAAGALRSAMNDIWEAVNEQTFINDLPLELADWMKTPAGLVRVLVAKLRSTRIEEAGKYNDAVEDCVCVLMCTIDAGAGAGKGIETAGLPSSASSCGPGPDLSDRPDLQKMREEILAPVPRAKITDVIDVQRQLELIKDAAGKTHLATVCARAVDVINGLMLIADVEKLACD